MPPMRPGINVESVEFDPTDTQNPYTHIGTDHRRFNSRWGENPRHIRARRIGFMATQATEEEENPESQSPPFKKIYTPTSAAARKRRLSEAEHEISSYAAHKWVRSLQAELFGVGEFDFALGGHPFASFYSAPYWCENCVHLRKPCRVCRRDHEPPKERIDSLVGNGGFEWMSEEKRENMEMWVQAVAREQAQESSRREESVREEEPPGVQEIPFHLPQTETDGSLDGDWDPWSMGPLRVTNPDIEDDSVPNSSPGLSDDRNTTSLPVSIPLTPVLEASSTVLIAEAGWDELLPVPPDWQLDEGDDGSEDERDSASEPDENEEEEEDEGENGESWFTTAEMLTRQALPRQPSDLPSEANFEVAGYEITELAFQGTVPSAMGAGFGTRAGWVDEFEREQRRELGMRRGVRERRLRLRENRGFGAGGGMEGEDGVEEDVVNKEEGDRKERQKEEEVEEQQTDVVDEEVDTELYTMYFEPAPLFSYELA